VESFDLGPAGLVVVELLGLFAGRRDQRNLVSDLLGCGALVDLREDRFSFVELAVIDELTW
jgi:hypothetical protein